jgi:hypothetical protein
MKTLIGIFLISTLLVSFTIPKDPNKLLWSQDNQLQWKDFAGPIKQIDGIDAWTAYLIEPIVEEGKSYINCYFEKKKSWRIKKKETDYLLRHEQYHFNIAEVHARKMRKEAIDKKLELNSKEFAKIFKDIFKDCEKTQKAYDKDTNHSKIPAEQSKWESDIDKQLQELNNFSNPMID